MSRKKSAMKKIPIIVTITELFLKIGATCYKKDPIALYFKWENVAGICLVIVPIVKASAAPPVEMKGPMNLHFTH